MSTDSLTDQIKSLEEELKKPLPTPHVGCDVHWFPNGKIDEDPIAAIVTGIEGPGRVKLTVFKPMAMQEHKQGVHWANHPAVANKAEYTRIHNGVWDYEKNSTVRKSHYDLHREHLQRKKDAAVEAKRQQLDADRAKANLEKSATGVGDET